MPWQLVSSQMGLSSSGLQERRRSQAERTEGPSLGLETPEGAGRAPSREAEPTGFCSGPVTGSLGLPYRPPAGRCHGLSRRPGPGSPIAAP